MGVATKPIIYVKDAKGLKAKRAEVGKEFRIMIRPELYKLPTHAIIGRNEVLEFQNECLGQAQEFCSITPSDHQSPMLYEEL